MITAKIIADSINPQSTRITSWLLEYPRFIHAEFMTHRDFSRNAASSRAIPLKTTIENINANPALPVWWGSNQKGMQFGPELTGGNLEDAKIFSQVALNECLRAAKNADGSGLHKSITNRWLEPWSHIKVIATITDMRNFFALRAHPAAQPEFQVLSYRMLEAYLTSTPVKLNWGEWHIPFNSTMDTNYLSVEQRLKLATARCCWVSYNKPEKIVGGNTSLEDAYNRHDESIKSGHWSPFEHCAQAIDPFNETTWDDDYPWSNFDTAGNCSGWGQYRKKFLQERKTLVDLPEIFANRPEWTIKAGL